MNERIKELWSQAGGHYNGGNQHTWPEYTIDDPEKFAELIVRECLKIVEPTEDSGDEWCVTLKGTAQEIKEHFGVE
jgi:hypothetical protein